MATVFIPNSFVAGTPAVATEVNQNFTAITDQVNGNLDADNLADGAVTAIKLASGAVTTSKIGDTEVSNAKIAAGVDASKIADGSVSDTEFQYLSGVTSNIQTQIDGIAVSDVDFSTGSVLLGGSLGDTVFLPEGLLVARYTLGGGVYGDVVFELLLGSLWCEISTVKGSSAGGGGSITEAVQVLSDGTNVRARNVGASPLSVSIAYQKVSLS
jgi:hypothetical protein